MRVQVSVLRSKRRFGANIQLGCILVYFVGSQIYINGYCLQPLKENNCQVSETKLNEATS